MGLVGWESWMWRMNLTVLPLVSHRCPSSLSASKNSLEQLQGKSVHPRWSGLSGERHLESVTAIILNTCITKSLVSSGLRNHRPSVVDLLSSEDMISRLKVCK
jgi:hypothetical protein